MDVFIPKRALFERDSLDYPIGRRVYEKMRELGVDVAFIGSHNRVTGIPGRTWQEAYFEGKRTLVVGVRRGMEFQTCKPSAHYQLPIVTSCMGHCEYCYLNTTLGKKPYIRIYVNIDEILERAGEYINEREPETTVFEGAATSDPLPVELYTGGLKRSVEFFAAQQNARFRFVTKFTSIDTLLAAEHNGHTTIRFSLNTDRIIRDFEHNTPLAQDRIVAAAKVAQAGYRYGFIIGPIFHYKTWRQDYGDMLQKLKYELKDGAKHVPAFELITHRFTKRAKLNILEVFPKTKVPMDETERVFKYGQFGYGKYVYPKEVMEEIKCFFEQKIRDLFPEADVLYFV